MNRDVLAELGSIEQYLRSLIDSDPMPGQDANLARLGAEMLGLRLVAENIIELHTEYISGVTHEQRVLRSMGQQPGQDVQAQITQLQAELTQAREQLAAAKEAGSGQV